MHHFKSLRSAPPQLFLKWLDVFPLLILSGVLSRVMVFAFAVVTAVSWQW